MQLCTGESNHRVLHGWCFRELVDNPRQTHDRLDYRETCQESWRLTKHEFMREANRDWY